MLVILTVELAALSAILDGRSLNYECYHGSIAKCDAIRNSFMMFGMGPFGAICGIVMFLAWVILDKADRIK